MAEDTYLMNINNFKEIFKANISYNRTRGPVISEVSFPKYVFSDETATVVFLSGYNWLELESVEVINATSSYDSSTHTLTISNPTSENVTVNYVICYKDSELRTIKLAGLRRSVSGTGRLVAYPKSGTIEFMNKYGEEEEIDISTLEFTNDNSYYIYYTPNDYVYLTNVKVETLTYAQQGDWVLGWSSSIDPTASGYDSLTKRVWGYHTYNAATDSVTREVTVNDLATDDPTHWEQLSDWWKYDTVIIAGKAWS